jgi:hypothetical protein
LPVTTHSKTDQYQVTIPSGASVTLCELSGAQFKDN